MQSRPARLRARADQGRARLRQPPRRRSVISESLKPAWSEQFDPPPIVRASGLPITAEWAFDGADGSGITVAVVDSGVDFNHSAVVGPMAPGAVLSWDRDAREVVVEEGDHEDLYGHGTACAAIVGRAAPASPISSVRVLGSRLSGKGEAFAAGLRWAIAHGARVMNLSLSTGKDEMFSMFHEVADEAAHAGVVLVCAMNNIFSPTFPSQFSSVISVAACDGDDPFRLLANPAPPADFGAPGIDVEVAWMDGGRIVATGNSFAAPHVTGLVARMLSKHPELTPYQVKAVLRAVADNAEF